MICISIYLVLCYNFSPIHTLNAFVLEGFFWGLISTDNNPHTWDRDTTELSSFMASSTSNLLGLSFFFRMAVAKSSLKNNNFISLENVMYYVLVTVTEQKNVFTIPCSIIPVVCNFHKLHCNSLYLSYILHM